MGLCPCSTEARKGNRKVHERNLLLIIIREPDDKSSRNSATCNSGNIVKGGGGGFFCVMEGDYVGLVVNINIPPFTYASNGVRPNRQAFLSLRLRNVLLLHGMPQHCVLLMGTCFLLAVSFRNHDPTLQALNPRPQTNPRQKLLSTLKPKYLWQFPCSVPWPRYSLSISIIPTYIHIYIYINTQKCPTVSTEPHTPSQKSLRSCVLSTLRSNTSQVVSLNRAPPNINAPDTIILIPKQAGLECKPKNTIILIWTPKP